jgi:hypothetical protein
MAKAFRRNTPSSRSRCVSNDRLCRCVSAAAGGIDRVEAADQAGLHRTQRDLVGRVPARGIGHGGDRRPVGVTAEAVAQHAVDAPEIVRIDPRPVAARSFQRIQQRAVAERTGIDQQAAPVPVLADAGFGDAPLDGVPDAQARRTRRREVALFGVIRTLPVIDAIDQLRNEPVQIGVAMAMRVGRHVGRHAVDKGREIGAVIEIEAAQEVLVRLAAPAVLRDDDAGHEFEHFGRTQRGPAFDQPRIDAPLTGGIGRADRVVVVSFHDDRIEMMRRRRRIMRPPHARGGTQQHMRDQHDGMTTESVHGTHKRAAAGHLPG